MTLHPRWRRGGAVSGHGSAAVRWLQSTAGRSVSRSVGRSIMVAAAAEMRVIAVDKRLIRKRNDMILMQVHDDIVVLGQYATPNPTNVHT